MRDLDLKKAECWRIDVFELWCSRRLLSQKAYHANGRNNSPAQQCLEPWFWNLSGLQNVVEILSKHRLWAHSQSFWSSKSRMVLDDWFTFLAVSHMMLSRLSGESCVETGIEDWWSSGLLCQVSEAISSRNKTNEQINQKQTHRDQISDYHRERGVRVGNGGGGCRLVNGW